MAAAITESEPSGTEKKIFRRLPCIDRGGRIERKNSK
jgi:hypothetical protein